MPGFSFLEDYLLANWSELPGAGPRPAHLSLLGQATGVSKACLFVFAYGETFPRYIAKIPRSPAYNEDLIEEVGTIQDLRESVSQDLRATLPGPMHLAMVSNHWVLVEPVVPGRLMESLIPSNRPLDREQTVELMDVAFEWLTKMQLEAPSLQGPIQTQLIVEHFLDPIRIAGSNSELTTDEQKYLDRLLIAARELEGHELPLYLYHGDFGPGNILMDDGRVAVLDWQFSRPLAPPLLDWFGFVFRLYSRSVGLPHIDGSLDEYRSAFDQVFCSRTWFAQMVADYTRAYCHKLKVDLEYVALLFSMFLISSINKFHAFLSKRAERGYLYLLKDAPGTDGTFHQRLRRQVYVWLLGDLVADPDKLLFAPAG